MFSYILLTGVLGIALNFVLVWTLRFVPGAPQAVRGGDDAA
jgi:hypothetical protein